MHDPTRRIAELTEELEELKSEKEMLLCFLDCTDDAGISAVKKEIATMETTLKKLEEQESKVFKAGNCGCRLADLPGGRA